VAGIEEVARRAGVSAATVSRALSGKGHVSAATRERVRQAADELGYVVSSSASALATGRMRNVGVVIPFLNRWFYGAVVEGADRHCSASAVRCRACAHSASTTSRCRGSSRSTSSGSAIAASPTSAATPR
jgi:Transcriptional regulators